MSKVTELMKQEPGSTVLGGSRIRTSESKVAITFSVEKSAAMSLKNTFGLSELLSTKIGPACYKICA